MTLRQATNWAAIAQPATAEGAERNPSAAGPAVQSILATYGGVLYARCRSILDDSEASEAAVCETFARMYPRLAEAPDTQSALRMIYREATTYCLRQIRLARTARRAATHGGRGSTLRSVIARAPEKVRAVAWLHYVDGMNVDELAAVMEMAPRSVATLLEKFDRQTNWPVGDEG